MNFPSFGFRRGPDLAIDLGTANMRIMVRGEGVVFDEPSLCYYEKTAGQMKLIAAGRDVLAMVDRVRRGGARKMVEAFTGSSDPLQELRVEGEAAARSVRDRLDQVSPGLGNPVMAVNVAVDDALLWLGTVDFCFESIVWAQGIECSRRCK